MRRLFRGALAVLIIAGALLAIPSSVSAQQASNPDARLVVNKSRLFIDEGKSKTFTVKLATQPRIVDLETDIRIYSTVNVAMKPADANIATIATANAPPGDDGWLRLTFTRDNWNVAQTVTVTAVSDNDRVDEMTDINFSTGSADSDYYDLDHDLTAVVLETQRDSSSPTSVRATVGEANGERRVIVSWNTYPALDVFRRNISAGESGFTYIGRASYSAVYYQDRNVSTDINLYRVGKETSSFFNSPRHTSRTVAVYFAPPGGA